MTLDFGGNDTAKSVNVPYSGTKFMVIGDDGTNILMARLLSNGDLDTSFNTSGKRSYALTGATTVKSARTTRDGDTCITGSTNANVDVFTLCVHP